MRKIARDEVLAGYQFPQFDGANDRYFYPKTVASYVLTLPSRSTHSHVTMLTKNMYQLINTMSIDTLLFLGETPTPWLYQHNNYRPVKAALDFLASKKTGKRFNGGIEIFTSELADFIPHLFWLTRCNAALPEFYFMDTRQNIIGNICKYGSLHIDALNTRSDELLQEMIGKTAFQHIEFTQCGSGRIVGRKTIA